MSFKKDVIILRHNVKVAGVFPPLAKTLTTGYAVTRTKEEAVNLARKVVLRFAWKPGDATEKLFVKIFRHFDDDLESESTAVVDSVSYKELFPDFELMCDQVNTKGLADYTAMDFSFDDLMGNVSFAFYSTIGVGVHGDIKNVGLVSVY